ncbi:Outer envelope protein 80, chloroplastic, variant 3 [Ancistrocladus abbreviatus]
MAFDSHILPSKSLHSHFTTQKPSITSVFHSVANLRYYNINPHAIEILHYPILRFPQIPNKPWQIPYKLATVMLIDFAASRADESTQSGGAAVEVKESALKPVGEVQEDVHRIIDSGYFASCMPVAYDTWDGIRLVFQVEPNQEFHGLVCERSQFSFIQISRRQI